MTVLQPYISQHFTGSVWRLEIDELSETIFVEARNEAEKHVSFSSVSLLTGKINFKDIVTPERWLTGIETAFDCVLVLHNYQSASGPAHKGLIAVDAVTGATLWSNYNYAFDYLTVAGPVLYDTRIHPKKLLLADVKTGSVSRIYEPDVHPRLTTSIIVPQLTDPSLLPLNLLPLPSFGNSVHYLEYNNFRIVSLHTLQSGQLKQYLYVMDGVNKIYEDLLNADIQKLQPESFILHKNRLVYIKNKSELIVLNL